MPTPWAGRITFLSYRHECEQALDRQIERAMRESVLALENKVKQLHTGPRHGRWYRIGKTPTKGNKAMGMKVGRWYQASAPGEPPAIRSSRLFKSVTHKVERQGDGVWLGQVGTNVKDYPPALEFGVKSGGAARTRATYRVTKTNRKTGKSVIAKVKRLTFAGGWRIAPRPMWRRAMKELKDTIFNIWKAAGRR
jgi:hypothetical protein